MAKHRDGEIEYEVFCDGECVGATIFKDDAWVLASEYTEEGRVAVYEVTKTYRLINQEED